MKGNLKSRGFILSLIVLLIACFVNRFCNFDAVATQTASIQASSKLTKKQQQEKGAG